MISLNDLLKSATTQTGASLHVLSYESPVLLVFLRHLGCSFCRETLSDIAEKREFLADKKILPVFVHMSPESEAQPIFEKYKMESYPRISDPEKNLYKAFGLQQGKVMQVLAPKVWWRGFVAAIVKGHGLAIPKTDALQMPGVFLIHKGEILRDFRHRLPSDRPNYTELSECQIKP